jgi:Na+/H+-dicarboxylate symporter
MFRKMPIILLTIILAVMFFDSLIPNIIKQVLYSTSLSIKSIIVFFLPFVIFSLLFKTSILLDNNATKIIGLILVLVCVSNFASTFLSHFIGQWVYQFDLSIINMPKESESLQLLWIFTLPKIVANDVAIFSGIILGLTFSKLCKSRAIKIAVKLEEIVNRMLKIMVYIIPLFVAGFIIKLQYDSVMMVIIKDYALIFLIIVISQITYVALMYLLLNNMNVKKSLLCIKNMIPAAIVGFSSMSSAASMPLTIIGAESNSKNKNLAGSVIPATVNIHLIGDCIAIPIFAYALLKSFAMPDPSLSSYLIFTIYFVLAKFSVAAIPGGGILVMIPILEKHLGFNGDMISLITALYILFDPIITCTNIFGNGAFAKLIDKSVSYLYQKKNSN